MRYIMFLSLLVMVSCASTSNKVCKDNNCEHTHKSPMYQHEIPDFAARQS